MLAFSTFETLLPTHRWNTRDHLPFFGMQGGGLAIASGSNATLTNSSIHASIHANNAPQGAGIINDGALTLTSTTVASNVGGGSVVAPSPTSSRPRPATTWRAGMSVPSRCAAQMTNRSAMSPKRRSARETARTASPPSTARRLPFCRRAPASTPSRPSDRRAPSATRPSPTNK